MASITEISVEHIHNAYESIRGNIAVEAFYAVVTGFMAVTLIHRLYTVYREVQSNEDGTPTMKDYMNLVWQYVFCIAAVALFPRAAGSPGNGVRQTDGRSAGRIRRKGL